MWLRTQTVGWEGLSCSTPLPHMGGGGVVGAHDGWVSCGRSFPFLLTNSCAAGSCAARTGNVSREGVCVGCS